jgi:hypothetical protein
LIDLFDVFGSEKDEASFEVAIDEAEAFATKYHGTGVLIDDDGG